MAKTVKTKSMDSQCRKYLLTINNPLDYDLNHDQIKAKMTNLSTVSYFCMADEIGENNTLHTHLFMFSPSGLRFSTVKGQFPKAHIDAAKGTCQQNRDYISKTGKWQNDKKHGTSIPDTFEEHGEMPFERPGARNDIADLYNLVKSGASNFEILEENPSHMLALDKIERARQVVIEEEYRKVFRKLNVTYIFGDTATKKTRTVMESMGSESVYRVTNYLHPFDQYAAQKVILFDEFHGGIKIEDMLNLLDGYPLALPCRYANKQACYTEVYIISNIELKKQYLHHQKIAPTVYDAFLRRIHKVVHYVGVGKFKTYSLKQYLKHFA